MSDTTFLLRKPTEILREGHDRVKELFARYERLDRAETARKRELFLKLREEISIQSRIEETLFYPAVQDMDAKRVREALESHRGLRSLLEELMEMGAGDEAFDVKMKKLRTSVEHHTRREETEIFPLAMRLPRKDLLELGAHIDGLRADLRDRPAEEDRGEEIPADPAPGTPNVGHRPSPPSIRTDPREKEARGFENWGSE